MNATDKNWIKPCIDLRRFALHDYREIEDTSKTVKELDDYLSAIIPIFERLRIGQAQNAREAYARAFRFLLFKPLPHQLSQSTFRGCLKILWFNIRLEKSHQPIVNVSKNVWMTLRVINLLFDIYVLPKPVVPSKLTKQHEGQRTYIVTMFFPTVVSAVSELLSFESRDFSNSFPNVFPQIVGLLERAFSFGSIRAHLKENGSVNMIALRLIKAVNLYSDKCIDQVVNEPLKKEFIVRLNRLAVQRRAKQLISSIWDILDEKFKTKIWSQNFAELTSMTKPALLNCLAFVVRRDSAYQNQVNLILGKTSEEQETEIIRRAYPDINKPILPPALVTRALASWHSDAIILTNLLGVYKIQVQLVRRAVERIKPYSQMSELTAIQTVIRRCPKVFGEPDLSRLVIENIAKQFRVDSEVDLSDRLFWLNVKRIRILNSIAKNEKPTDDMVEFNAAPNKTIRQLLIGVVEKVFKNSTSHLLYKEAFELLATLTRQHFIEEQLWEMFVSIFGGFLLLGKGYRRFHFNNMMQPLYNFIILKPGRFLVEDTNLEIVRMICQSVLRDKKNKVESIDTNVAKLIEIMIFEFGTVVNDYMPVFIELVVARLQRQVKTKHLEQQLLLVLIAALYTNGAQLVDTFEEIEKKQDLRQQIILNSFIKRWFMGIKCHFDHSYHSLRLSFVGICALISLPSDRRTQVSSLVATNAFSLLSHLHKKLLKHPLSSSYQASVIHYQVSPFPTKFDLHPKLDDVFLSLRRALLQIKQSDSAWLTRLTEEWRKRAARPDEPAVKPRANSRRLNRLLFCC